ncbi:MAG: UDP-3-O-(3-hydroxymyristoyl)glucosamine N-acyltransferase [Betaproteobacteria bacterium]|nr:UDP-3-O-(3-hydroxymyristoyl)glucosamine N-acyltransferase [Betaproteobacteria bacterium]MDE2623279.1 UDP-3-O-(3-hydroxymyristoyl)glucosamine N-acyltransferase [Betaproteobacteria bacterium]
MRSFSLQELAEACGGEVVGEPRTRIHGVGTLEHAVTGELTFLTNSLYRDQLQGTRASAVILGPEDRDATQLPRIVSANPYACYALVAQRLFPLPEVVPGIHPSAVIDPAAQVSHEASIGPHTTVGSGAIIGPGVVIGPGCSVGERVVLEAGARLYPRVVIYPDCRIGPRSILHAGVVIGADGFGMARGAEGWIKIPQVGRVIIGADVEIGANTTVDRGAIEDTVIEDGVKLDNQIQIAHNCRVGAHTVIAGCTGISGSTRIGRNCRIGGGVGMVGHLEICDGVTVSGFSLITKSITRPGVYTSSIPSQPHRQWMETLANLRALPQWTQKLKMLEAQLKKNSKEEE